MYDGQSRSNRGARQVLSTEHVGADQWLDLVNDLYPGISVDSYRGFIRRASLGASLLADAQITEISSNSPVHVACAPAPTGSSDWYSLGMLAVGNCRSRHAGREEVWNACDLVLFDNSQSFDAVHSANFHLMMWHLPREALAPMLAAPDWSIGVRIPGSAGPGAILGSYLRALLTEGPRCDPTTQRSLLSHLYGLVGLTLGASLAARESRQEIRRAVRRQQIFTYIETHLHDPRLTAQRAARELRMSLRWLHALLEESEISFAAWVTRRRLEECRKFLCNKACDHLTVAEVALRSGFGNLSTFNRRFRAHFGMTPRDLRRLERSKRQMTSE